jgi:hypothetical protein
MESGFMQMVVADTMKKRPFITILCMHKMETRAISLGYGGFYHMQHNILHCEREFHQDSFFVMMML